MNEKQLEEARKLALRNYNLVLSKDRLSDGSIMYMARNPELKGCKAQGTTQMEAIKNLRDARIDYIYYLLEDGIDVPSPNTQENIISPQVIPPTKVFSSISNDEIIDGNVSAKDQKDSLEIWSNSEPVEA